MTDDKSNVSSPISPQKSRIPSPDSATADVRSNPPSREVRTRTRHDGLLRPSIAALYIEDIEDPLFIKIDGTLTFGRTPSPMPQGASHFIDLNPFHGFEKGVSRVHAILGWKNGQLYLEDQNSSNGSYVNQTRLAPHVPHRVLSGDTIELGQLVIDIYFMSDSQEKAAEKNTYTATASPIVVPGADKVLALPMPDGRITIADDLVSDARQVLLDGEIKLIYHKNTDGTATLNVELSVNDKIAQVTLESLFNGDIQRKLSELRLKIDRQ